MSPPQASATSPRLRSSKSRDAFNSQGGTLIEVSSLNVHFDVRGPAGEGGARIRAVDGVSFQIEAGTSFGLVGESGSGKSTIARAVLGLIEPTSGSVRLMGRDISSLSGRERRQMYRSMQFVSQDPYASLNPKMTVERIVLEPLVIHGASLSKPEAKARLGELLETVGLDDSYASRLRGELSGGERQRVAIARALSIEPSLVVCDEPTSALDVSITVQILGLLDQLKRDRGISLLYISHDLATVSTVADEVAVLYAGQIVEQGRTADLFRTPAHPYTKALISSIPVPDPDFERSRPRIRVIGDAPSSVAVPSGCRFHPRCPFARSFCSEQVPALLSISGERRVACHFWDELVDTTGQ